MALPSTRLDSSTPDERRTMGQRQNNPVVAIDPGTKSGLAAMCDGKLYWAKEVTCDHLSPSRMFTWLTQARQHLGVEDSQTVDLLVEGQFLGVNPHSMVHTVQVATAWEMAAAIKDTMARVNWRVLKRVMPSSWRSTLGHTGKSAKLKRAAKSVVHNHFPSWGHLVDLTTKTGGGSELSDAICIAVHHSVRVARTPPDWYKGKY